MITDHRDLTKLASQLHSEYDRNHYTKVISMAEQLQSRIQELQKIKLSKLSSSSTLYQRQGGGTLQTDITTTSINKQQPLDRYYQLLERSQSIQKQLNRISTEYSFPQHQQKQQSPLPPHPPPSFPPPSLPPPTTTTSSPPKPPQKTTLDIRLPSTPPPTPKKDNVVYQQNHHKKDDPLITPPASPRIKQVRFQDHSSSIEEKSLSQYQNESPLPPLPPSRELPPIIHVQKKINGLRGFLTRTYQLSDNLVMSRAHITPLRLFTATEILTGKPKAVLKIVITSHHDHGFSFYWPSSPAIGHHGSTTTTSLTSNNNNNNNALMIKPNRSQDMAKFSLVPDHLVQDALDSWIQQQGGCLPPLYQATHILRESIKIYVVYNRYHFNL
ncbi:hypothetical protein BDA99DRAFT_541620 [Phascolomyces articulosus]|uniref:Uncharacterized protein n=1 Tax=Phascolomyces articulosus TaxID=60185 RepID=A0AAD5K1R8_9FUNG|nr:hypothetical protein BDA99DRAFT_541620 [Phascolomyces articulosus]